MAIYKPNNFYPYLQEVNMEDVNGQIFGCQANTDGQSVIQGARINILSQSGEQLYENAFSFDVPIRDKENAECLVKPYEVNIDIGKTEINNSIGKLVISDINFFSLCPDMNVAERSKLCPFDIYKTKTENYYFGLIIEPLNNSDVIRNYIYHLKNIDIVKTGNNFELILNIVNFLDITIEELNSNYKLYFCLINNKDYLWNIELFEHDFGISGQGTTFVSDGYVTGSTQNVLWYNQNSQDLLTIKEDPNITDDCFVEIEATIDNSDFCKEEVMFGKTDQGVLSVKKSNNGESLYDNSLSGFWFSDNKNTNLSFYVDKYVFDENNKKILNSNMNTEYIIHNGNDSIPFFIKEEIGNDMGGYGIFQNVDIVSETTAMTSYDLYYRGSSYPINMIVYKQPCMGYELIGSDGLNMQLMQYESYYNEQLRGYKSIFNNYTPKHWKKLINYNISIDENKIDILINQDTYVSDINVPRIFDRRDINKEGKNIITLINDYRNENLIEKIVNFEIDNTDYDVFKFGVNTEDITVIVTSYIPDDLRENIKDNDEQIIVINGKEYRAKILFPAPLQKDYYFIYNDFNKYVDPLPNSSPNSLVTNITYNINKENLILSNTSLTCYNDNKYNAILNLSGKDMIFYESFYNFSKSPFDDVDICCLNLYENSCEYQVYNGMECELSFKIYGGFTTLSNLGNPLSFKFKYKIKDLYNNIETTYYKNIEYTLIGDTVREKNTFPDKFNQENGVFEFKTDISIPLGYKEPVIEIFLYAYDLSYENSWINFYNPEITVKEQSDKLLLNDNVVDFSEYDNVYLSIQSSDNPEEYTDCKINKFSYYSKTIQLEDVNKESTLINDIVNNGITYNYTLKHIERKKVNWISRNLGLNQNINKIETKDPFDVNLKNNTKVDIYYGDNKNTYNSFFGVRDSNINVDNLYIRFPGYIGYDHSEENFINDNKGYGITKVGETPLVATEIYEYENNILTKVDVNPQGIKGWFYQDGTYYDGTWTTPSSGTKYPNVITWSEDSIQSVDLYGKNVRADAFEQHDDCYCKLFKVISYDYETGEFVIAGGLNRQILPTDRYEVWKANVIEGSSNQYDITEVKTTYSRVYPVNNDYEKETFVSSEKVLTNGLKIMNSSSNQLFIQPNINFYSNEINFPYIFFDKYNEKINLEYNYINKDIFNITDRTIDKLDNSQWLINIKEQNDFNVYPGLDYRLYVDTVNGDVNIFYAKENPIIDIKYGDYTYVKKKIMECEEIEEIRNFKNSLKSINDDFVGDIYYINNMDVSFLATYENCDTLIKRYRYKIYDSDMSLIYNSDYVYDNLLMCSVRGLIANNEYYLILEIENNNNNIITIDKYFCPRCLYKISNELFLDITSIDEENCFKIDIKKSMNTTDYCTYEDLIEFGAKDDIPISLFRKSDTDGIVWVSDIDLNNDKIYIDNQKYMYSLFDYNISNSEFYEYFLVLNKNQNSENLNNYVYNIISGSQKTQFCDWSIVDIVETDDGLYEISGDVWKFKYNLESQDIQLNNSISTYDNLGMFPQLGYGNKNYVSSSLTCLLGDVGVYYVKDNDNNLIKKEGYYEKEKTSSGYAINNIQKFRKWKSFCNSMNLKLLRDIKGNKWIVSIMENPSVKNNDASSEQIYTISFSWSEMMNNNISIIRKLESFDKEQYLINKIDEIWGYYWDYNYDSTNNNIILKRLKQSLNDDYILPTSLSGVSDISVVFKDVDDTNYAPFNEISTSKSLTINKLKDKNLDYLYFGLTCNEISTIIDTEYTSSINGLFENVTANKISLDIYGSNYISTQDLLKDIKCDNVIINIINTSINENTFLLYCELYEQYGTYSNVKIVCKDYEFNLENWSYDKIDDGFFEVNGLSCKGIILTECNDDREFLFIPDYYYDSENGCGYVIHLAEGIIIGGPLITFNISGKSYIAEKGMTWREFLYSEYKSYEFNIYNGSYVRYLQNYIYLGGTGEPVRLDNSIVSGGNYFTEKIN